ncbi:DUF488 domain-containing protein [Sphingobium agri]|uniref:DUF488 domain-containing protein n=1 Tax=Sphingobium agri TaxID=2933566 RepID=A0ABT0DTD0_9SPHN|nr:DUF488 domain-containing protein [Sphingobium agri]MCK0530377.1 DUF488 domain-containing protein [Sphingobium agri]
MRRNLYTIGYEGAEISHFLETLRDCGIQRVIDIRDVPVSRKPGFSKRALCAALEKQGISYSHFKPLGDPKAGRDAMRRGDYEAFSKIYNAHLALETGQRALKEAIELASRQSSALLCFERSPKECHRTIVAIEMCKYVEFDVRNLGVNKENQRGNHMSANLKGMAAVSL